MKIDGGRCDSNGGHQSGLRVSRRDLNSIAAELHRLAYNSRPDDGCIACASASTAARCVAIPGIGSQVVSRGIVEGLQIQTTRSCLCKLIPYDDLFRHSMLDIIERHARGDRQ